MHRVRERITALADTVDLVGLTDNHAGQPRMSPLAAVALAREQGVATVVHISCRDRNRLALQSQVVGAAALGSEGVLCLYGDPVDGVARVKDLTATALIEQAKERAAPQELAVGAVVNPFAPDIDREVRLLEHKIACGVDFLQSQMIFDLDALRAFLDRVGDLLAGVRFYAGVALLRNQRMADPARRLPGCLIPDRAHRQIGMGGGTELATKLASIPGSTRCTSSRSEPKRQRARSPQPSALPAGPQPGLGRRKGHTDSAATCVLRAAVADPGHTPAQCARLTLSPASARALLARARALRTGIAATLGV